MGFYALILALLLAVWIRVSLVVVALFFTGDLPGEGGVLAQADVFIQNFRPGVAERMGFGEEALRAIKPDLIYVSISGFGVPCSISTATTASWPSSFLCTRCATMAKRL